MDDTFRLSLPDMSTPALSERLVIASRSMLIQVSAVRHFDDYGPDLDVIHVWVLGEDSAPLTLRDLRPEAAAEEAYDLWGFLCEQLSASAVLAYGLRAGPDGEPNPRLGCWGRRPDLAGDRVDDSSTALVIGMAVDTRQATQPARERVLALAVRSAVVVSLRRWLEPKAYMPPSRSPRNGS